MAEMNRPASGSLDANNPQPSSSVTRGNGDGDAISRSEERLRFIVEGAELGTWDWDISTGKLLWSDRCLTLFGLEPGCHMTYERFLEAVHPEDRARADAAVRRTLELGTDYQIEIRTTWPDGSIHWVDSRGHRYEDQNGNPVRIAGVAFDITSRKRAEEALQRNEDRLLLAIEAADLGTWDLDLTTGTAARSLRHEQIFGYQELQPQWNLETALRHVLPEDRDKFRAAHAPSPGKTGMSVEARIRRPDGSVRWIVSSGRFQYDSEGRAVRIVGVVADITDRKAVDHALRQSEEQFRVLTQNLHSAVALIDERGAFSIVNNSFRRIFGIPDDADILNVNSHDWAQWQVLDENGILLDVSEHPVRKAALTGTAVRDQLVGVKSAAGSDLKWLLVSAEPVLDAEGKLHRLICTYYDITDRRATEAALRRSEARWNAAIESLAEGAIIATEDEQVIYWNPAARAMHGFTRSDEGIEPLERTPVTFELWTPDGAHKLELDEWPMRRIKRGETVRNLELRARRPDQGWEKIFSYSGVMVDTAGGERLIFLSCHDLTDLRNAGLALRESEARERARAAELEGILEAAPVALFISLDSECRNMIGSKLTYETLRLSPGANVSKSAPEGEARATFRAMRDGREIPPEELPGQKAAATGQPVRGYEFDVVYEDGTYRNMLGDAVPLFGEDGKPRGAVGAFVDITERKRTEERLRQTQKLESIGMLAGGVAHEFNNILTGVMGNASLLLEGAEPEQAELLRSIIANSERAAHLTRELLAYSGKGRFIVRELDVTQAVNEVADLVQLSIPKSVSLALNLERRLPSVAMDPGQLQQILMNLVSNASEAIGEGNPGRITVSTSTADIRTPFTGAAGEEVAAGRYVCIEVRDTGSGIAPENRPQLFDPFFTTKFIGRGLGLAAVAGILRSQKGGITVESVPNHGSTFRVFLPAIRETGLSIQAPVAEDRREAVLVVDDEIAVRKFISAVLRSKGYHVIEASDGQEALALCASEPGAISAGIIDIVMPNMGANELLPALKARQPGMRILLTSGYSESEARRLCSAYPGAAFIQKPYTAQQLAKTVADLLSKTL